MRNLAEAIERQTGYAAELYNVDIRLDQRYLAEQGQVPCCEKEEDRFSADIPLPFRILEIQAEGNLFSGNPFRSLRVVHDREERLCGPEPEVLGDLSGLLGSFDPDVILFPLSDLLLPRLLSAARERGIELPFSRSGRYRKMAGKSYMSYGRTEYRAGSLIPDGRILIDTTQSFHYRESGLLSGFIRMEKGCERCDFCQSVEDQNRLFLLEEWDTLKNLIAHLKSEKFSVIRGAMSLLREPYEMMFHTVFHPKGMEEIYPKIGRSCD